LAPSAFASTGSHLAHCGGLVVDDVVDRRAVVFEREHRRCAACARPGNRLDLGSIRARVLSTTAGGRIKRVLLAVGTLATSAAFYASAAELRPTQAFEYVLMSV
jgi:hypothetical protein